MSRKTIIKDLAQALDRYFKTTPLGPVNKIDLSQFIINYLKEHDEPDKILSNNR